VQKGNKAKHRSETKRGETSRTKEDTLN